MTHRDKHKIEHFKPYKLVVQFICFCIGYYWATIDGSGVKCNDSQADFRETDEKPDDSDKGLLFPLEVSHEDNVQAH